MGRLKEDIKHECCLKRPKIVMESMQHACHNKSKYRDTHKSIIGTYAGSRDKSFPHRETLPQLLKYHKRKWMKKEKNDYVLVVATNGLKGINVKKQNCSLWRIMMRRK